MMIANWHKNISFFAFGAIADIVFYVYSSGYYFIAFILVATLIETAVYYFIAAIERENGLIGESRLFNSELYSLYLNSSINKLSIFGSMKRQVHAEGNAIGGDGLIGMIYKKMLYGREFSDALLSASKNSTSNRYIRETILRIRGNYLRSHSFANAVKEEYDRLAELAISRIGNNAFGIQKYATASMVASVIVPSLLTFVIIGYSMIAYSYIEIDAFALALLVAIPSLMRIILLKTGVFNEI